MTAPLRVAVIGAGIMGRSHLRIYKAMAGVELVAVYDSRPSVADWAAATFGCRSLADVAEVVGIVDAVSIATPSATHAEVGIPLLRSGVHCLVEKPLATSEADAAGIISAAAGTGAVLLVGHVERFNPAVQALTRMLASGVQVQALDARRMSAVSARVTDVDVVMDLMIHDIDIVLSIVREPVRDIAAFSARGVGASGADYVQALLSFEGGTLASLTASRITQNKVRELQLTTDRGSVELGYGTQELLIYREGSLGSASDFGVDYVLDVSMERIAVRKAEPLFTEIQHFVAAIREGEPLLLSAEAAFEALRVAWRIQSHIGSQV